MPNKDEVKKTQQTAADLHAQSARDKQIIQAFAKELRLRQWAVEQVVKISVSQPQHFITLDEAKKLSEFFYTFVTTL